mmetsp:Transcript_92010/g.297690  ORF Transcript_92010/g.297690 Transcript_92010/m.297690 type:complete len:298 (-) Transcript_92010:1064-1957(-)
MVGRHPPLVGRQDPWRASILVCTRVQQHHGQAVEHSGRQRLPTLQANHQVVRGNQVVPPASDLTKDVDHVAVQVLGVGGVPPRFLQRELLAREREASGPDKLQPALGSDWRERLLQGEVQVATGLEPPGAARRALPGHLGRRLEEECDGPQRRQDLAGLAEGGAHRGDGAELRGVDVEGPDAKGCERQRRFGPQVYRPPRCRLVVDRVFDLELEAIGDLGLQAKVGARLPAHATTSRRLRHASIVRNHDLSGVVEAQACRDRQHRGPRADRRWAPRLPADRLGAARPGRRIHRCRSW